MDLRRCGREGVREELREGWGMGGKENGRGRVWDDEMKGRKGRSDNLILVVVSPNVGRQER